MSGYAKVTEYVDKQGKPGTSVSFFESAEDRYSFGFGVSKAKKFLAAYDGNPEGVITLIRNYAEGKAKPGDSSAKAKPKKAAKKAKATEVPNEAAAAA